MGAILPSVRIRIKNLDTGTFPCVLHHNGGDSICCYGLELKRRYFELIGRPGRFFHYSKSGRAKVLQTYRRPVPRRPLRPIPDLSIVTWTSFRFPGSAELSLASLGVKMEVIRPSEPYSNIKRIRWLRDYLDAVDTDYVMVMDSHDTFVTSDIHYVVESFRKLGCSILFQGEGNDWPPADDLRKFYDSIVPDGSPFAYLCAGIFMGEREFMKRVVDRALEIPPVRKNSDQGIYKRAFAEFHPEAQIDYECALFQSLTDYKHATDPLRYTPVELRLEIQFQPGDDPAPDPRAFATGKLLRALPYKLARGWDALRDRVDRRRAAVPPR